MEESKIESLDEAIDELLSLGYLQYVEPDKLLEVTEADRRIELYDEEDRLERERDAFLEDIRSRLNGELGTVRADCGYSVPLKNS